MEFLKSDNLYKINEKIKMVRKALEKSTTKVGIESRKKELENLIEEKKEILKLYQEQM